MTVRVLRNGLRTSLLGPFLFFRTGAGFRWLRFQARLILLVLTTLLFLLLLLAFVGLFTADVGRLIPRVACLLTISASECLRPFGGQRSWGEREIHSEYQD